MILLPREHCYELRKTAGAASFSTAPLQVGMDRDPWKVAVASTLLCRARRVQAAPALERLLAEYPDPESMCRAEYIEDIVRPTGMQNSRARALRRMSLLWLEGNWECMSKLPGVGVYVRDAVKLFCFGDVDIESQDEVLREYAFSYVGPTLARDVDPAESVRALRELDSARRLDSVRSTADQQAS